jgi:peptidoglycan/LPS O-acetylase OafA/YrhL
MNSITTNTITKSPRRHDLDALRAVAMLLGIVLHAALAFAPLEWIVKDSQQHAGFA